MTFCNCNAMAWSTSFFAIAQSLLLLLSWKCPKDVMAIQNNNANHDLGRRSSWGRSTSHHFRGTTVVIINVPTIYVPPPKKKAHNKIHSLVVTRHVLRQFHRNSILIVGYESALRWYCFGPQQELCLAEKVLWRCSTIQQLTWLSPPSIHTLA